MSIPGWGAGSCWQCGHPPPRGAPALPLPRPLFQMTFYFSDTVVLLFDFWNVHSPTGMALSVLLILLLAVLYEAVKMGKAVLLRRALLALPRSLSQEALTEPQEGDSDPAQGRYHGTPCTLLWGLWPHGQHKGSRAGTTGPPCTLLRGL
nr:probable low affinity copper uptake protein 2 isoform X2 [Taeniopygia guttata]